jgi:hypothetical protein
VNAQLAPDASAMLSEPTPIGEQRLVPGVVPITMRDRLQARMTAPLLPTRPQKPLDLGLFDHVACNQLDLFGISGRAKRADPEGQPPAS